jgi:peptidyl-prolyl cis-trans isomerase SurA
MNEEMQSSTRIAAEPGPVAATPRPPHRSPKRSLLHSAFCTLHSAIVFLLVSVLPISLQGQETLDRVVAVVGRTPILYSEIDEKVFQTLQGRPAPTEPKEQEALRRQALDELIDEELLYQLAVTDTTVKVTEEEVTSAVDEQVRNIRRRFQTDEQLRAELRESGFLSLEEYRRWLTEKQRRQLITSAFIKTQQASGKIKPVVPTDREIRAVFERERGRQRRPESVSFRQIVVAPTATPAAKQRALALADSILQELRKGADFATAARRFSADPGSKEQGGSLGWFRRGVMHTRFEDVAFNLRPGVVSEPVETPFGFHLIQVERIQPAEVSARHILIAPEIRQEDADSARARAESIRAALQAGANFDSIARLHHDSQEEREFRDFPADRLLPVYTSALQNVPNGAIAEVARLEFEGDPLRSKYAVMQLVERKDAGEYRYEDVKDQLRNRLGENLAIRRFLDRLRLATYVEVRELELASGKREP